MKLLPLKVGIVCALYVLMPHAEVMTDSSFHAPINVFPLQEKTVSPTGTSFTLSAPTYDIPANLGRLQGDNLFHSFLQFNIGAGETAAFSGPSSVQNIISRVTGGNASTIDGRIQSTIPQANFFLLNPHGIIFGANGRVSVDGAFHASTADTLQFTDGTSLPTGTAKNSVYTAAPPSAFGFLNENPASIVSSSQRLVNNGNDLVLAGGNIQLNTPRLIVQAGDLQLISSAGQGSIEQGSDGTWQLNGAGGQINIQNGLVAAVSTQNKAGRIFIRGGKIALQGGNLISSNTVAQIAGQKSQIVIEADTLNISQGAQISSNAAQAGAGGNIHITARDQILLEGGDGDVRFSGIRADVSPSSTGAAGGNIRIETAKLDIQNGARISATSFGAGDGGNVQITATEAINITGEGTEQLAISLISANARSTGRGGNIAIQTPLLNIQEGARISANTFDAGQGGNIQITADQLTVAGSNSRDTHQLSSGIISATTQAADGGSVIVQAQNINIQDGAFIAGDSAGAGQGGSVQITANETLTLSGGNNATRASFIGSSAQASGQGGTIQIKAGNLVLADGAQINSISAASGDAGTVNIQVDNTFSAQGTHPNTALALKSGVRVLVQDEAATAQAGNINIQTAQLILADEAIFSSGTAGGGNGGNIIINATQSVALSNDASIRASSGSVENTQASGAGGRIEIQTAALRIKQAASLEAQSFGSGDGGNIDVRAADTQLSDNASITAETQGVGHAGTIFLEGNTLALDSGARVTASSAGSGLGGSIAVTYDAVQISNHASISASSSDIGAAGDIALQVNSLTLTTGGQMSAGTSHAGDGGRIFIQAQNISLSDDSRISATSLADANTPVGTVMGKAGEIRIAVGDVLLLRKSQIQSATDSANGGDIIISGAEFIRIKNQGSITTSVQAAEGNGGNLTLNSEFLMLDNGKVIAQAVSGDGGNINITTKAIFETGNSLISASSQFGVDGAIDIQSPDGDVSDALIALPTNFNAKALIRNTCAGKTAQQSSRFVAVQYVGSPIAPDDWQVNPLALQTGLISTSTPKLQSQNLANHPAVPVFHVVCASEARA